MNNLELIELTRRELKEAKFLWEQQYDLKYTKKFGVVDSEKKKTKYFQRKDNAYFQNKKLKTIRNKSYSLMGMTYQE